MNHKKCSGWWEQDGERCQMEGLTLQIKEGSIHGGGYDAVGMFTFDGSIGEEGDVHMIKQYLGEHRVLYVGEYDGDKLLWGIWKIGWMSGPWEIRLKEDGEEEEAKEKREIPESIQLQYPEIFII